MPFQIYYYVKLYEKCWKFLAAKLQGNCIRISLELQEKKFNFRWLAKVHQ